MANTEYSAEEFKALKDRANLMGISFSPNISANTLAKRIDNALSSQGLESEESTPEREHKVDTISHEQFTKETQNKRFKDASKLVRIRLTCMNPEKGKWPGEIFSVGSAKLGTFKRFVPFNAEEGWHIPRVMLEMIKDRKYSSFYTVKDSKGREITRSKLVPEFSVEILPPLTAEERKDISIKKAMAEGKSE